MPPRKKNNDATASELAGVSKRSTRTSQKSTPIPSDSPLDELSPQSAVNDTQQDETVQESIVCVSRSKSYASSRPSTANSDVASQLRQLRTVSSPVTKKDIEMLDVCAKEEDELAGEGPAFKKTKPSEKEAPTNSRKGRSKYDNPEEMLTNPRAPLAKAKLRDLLCSTRAWDVLSAEEKKSVLSKFPDWGEVLDAGTENARPNIAALRNNDNFRHDVARYQEDLRKGWHDPEWIVQAREAHRKREIGAYNDYLSARFQDDWGMAMPGLYDSQEANKGSDDEDAMTGVEATAQQSEGGSLAKEGPKKADDLKDGQTQSSDVLMVQDEHSQE
ncbi:Asx homology domain-containing protein [Hypoxylon sp. NC0597]|nr:Asx homology domain-containing protein [Hypoxylon sp. NC0597]